MVRLHALVEGQTEESFINEILAPELATSLVFVDARTLTTGRKHGKAQKGGGASYDRVRRELVRWMKEDQGHDSWFTTMFDFYRLDTSFPGFDNCMKKISGLARVECLETMFAADIKQVFQNGVSRRFIPYIQLHEFESLVYADPNSLSTVRPYHDDAIAQLIRIKHEAGGAELVDGGENTSPSKWLIKLIPDYAKLVDGILAIKHMGLAKLRSECPHFDSWINRLTAATSA